METDNRIVKYKGQIRKSSINILVWLENNPNPSEEKVVLELIPLQRKQQDAIFNFRENIKDWDKHTTTLPLDESRLKEQKEFLDENQFVEGAGN